MPTSLLNTDTAFPHFTGTESDRKQMETVLNYLFMLREELKYTFANIGMENFNDAEMKGLVKMISSPIYAHLKDTDGNVSSLQLTAKDLSARLTDENGNMSSLQLLSSSLNSRITSLNGSVSVLSQSVDSMFLSVSNGEVSSTISLYKDGVAISSQNIRIQGMVTFTDLSTSGWTTINGDNITTGTINAITVTTTLSSSGQVGGEHKFYYLYQGDDNYLAGGIRLDDAGMGTNEDATYRMYIYTRTAANGRSFALKLYSDSKLSMEAEEYVYAGSGGNMTLEANGDLILRAFTRSGYLAGLNLESDAYLYIAGGDSATIEAPEIFLEGDVYVNGVLLTV